MVQYILLQIRLGKDIHTAMSETDNKETEKNETAKTEQPAENESEISKTDSDPENVEHEDNLELHSLSFFARQRAKMNKLKKNMDGMNGMQKFAYIFSYYKWRILVAAIILAICILLPVTIYKNTRPIAISYVIVNAKDPDAVCTDFVDNYIETYNIKKPYRITYDVDVHLDKETYLEEFSQNTESSDYTELPLKCYNGYYDIIIMDEKGMEYCGMQEITYPLKNYFPADIYSQIEDRIAETAGYDGAVVPFAIDISDTSFAKSLNLGYDTVYLGFPGNNEQNYKNAKRILNYVLDIELDTEAN